MAKTRSHNASTGKVTHGDQVTSSAAESSKIPASELLSFLKDVRGVQPWAEKELADILRIGSPQAKQATAVLQLQGYIESAGSTGKWRVTEQGEIVSGARPPRFTRQSVQDALAGLRDRIKAVNEDANAPYSVADAVGFGDFLRDAARVQAAEVGIRLVPKSDSAAIASAKEHAAKLQFLKQLRGKAALIHLIPYEDWMSFRSHVRLL